MNISDLVAKYSLSKNDFWDCQGNKIICHDAVEKIMVIENITVDKIDVLNSEWDFCRLLVTCSKGDKSITTIGEALLNIEVQIGTNRRGAPKYKGNCESQYIGAMAEKRGVDRAVLKLINAYQYGIYSDVEADSFIRQDSRPETTLDNIINKQKLLIAMIGDDIEKAESIKKKLNIKNNVTEMSLNELDMMIKEAKKGVA